ncbi:MAG TPA: prepilin-type N-terminal cleavage/methylation domain-containing protein [Thermoanaerobaculia bacterium]|nr:prepilin-type N-terminal cleavage/methylation domain-containing protein [Thermoanaerobaculia bacterium]
MDMVLISRQEPRRGDAGMTLIEVLVATTILGLALLALAPMFTSAVRTNASAYQMTNSNTLAREKLEELSGYPRSDPRLAVVSPNNASGPTTASVGTGSVVGINTWCQNDLPAWYNPETGATAPAGPRPGIAWFSYPFTRTYTVEQFGEDLVTRIVAPAPYVVKVITVTVRPTSGPFPGLRMSRQALILRLRDG